PPLFDKLLEWSGMTTEEAFRVFNMGIGMVLVVDPAQVASLVALLPAAHVIGQLVRRRAGKATVTLSEAPVILSHALKGKAKGLTPP
ncbi:MAG: AIR synthase-related protein, partial [Ardenticatenaceae bacterium]